MIIVIAILCAFIMYQALKITSLNNEINVLREYADSINRSYSHLGSGKIGVGLHFIMDNCHSMELNANDLFAPASSDSVSLCPQDLHWAVPFVEKHGYDGVVAVMSYIEGVQPMEHYRTKGFKKAIEHLKEMRPSVSSEAS